MASSKDRDILRELGRQYMAAANDPRNAETIGLWKALNSGRMQRPMVNIDQLPHHELEADGSQACLVEDPFWRSIERNMRRQLYMWNHFPVDMVLEPFIKLPMAVTDSGYGLTVEEDLLISDHTSDIMSHRYKALLDETTDLSIIHDRTITHDSAETNRRIMEGEDIFAGIAPVRAHGIMFSLGIWDDITTWLGIENCYITLLDNPDFIHRLLRRMTDALLTGIRQANALNVSNDIANTCHCSYVYDDAFLPAPGAGKGALTKNSWAYGLAQLFSSASPEVTREFELPYVCEMAKEFGNIYYGCCDKLSDRMDLLKQIPNIRKASCSPWSDKVQFTEEVDPSIIISCKPNPAFLATNTVDEDVIRRDLQETCDFAKKYNKRLEFILKDVSTVRYKPERLTRWHEIAMKVVKSW